jgi:hypothetical protein
MRLSVSLGSVLLCLAGMVALAQAQSAPGDKGSPAPAEDPAPDPDDPGPAPDNPEPLPDKVQVPEPGTVKEFSYVDDLPKPPEVAGTAKRAGVNATICLNAHLQGIGWQGWRCQPTGRVDSVGTTGQSRRMEALAVVTFGTGGVCAIAHVQNIGWQGWACGGDAQVIAVGTTGLSLRMEALGIGTFGSGLCARAHVAFLGWLGWTCVPPGWAGFVGTTGQSRRMEALDVVLQ